MAVIDPAGLFNGDRLSLLSDEARMAWPHLFCASNSLGRMELSAETLRHEVFGRFRRPPTRDKIWQWLEEYFGSWLLFIYQSDDGKKWGQWWTSERYLPRHKLTADLRTPAPDGQTYLKWQAAYVEARKTVTTCSSNNFKNFRKISLGVGIGVGGGIGKGRTPLPPKGGGEQIELAKLTTEPESGTLPKRGLDAETSRTADQLCERHPKGAKRTTPSEAKRQIEKILRRHKIREPHGLLALIDNNHALWCATEDWSERGGRYAKKLANWLAPTEDRYLDPPPENAAGGMSGALSLLDSEGFG